MKDPSGAGGDANNFITYLANSAPPTTGTWFQGDIVWNSAPVEGGNVGWVCTVGGTPGTWLAFGSFNTGLSLQNHKVAYFSGASLTNGMTPGQHWWGFAGFTSAGTITTVNPTAGSKLSATLRVTFSATTSSQLGINESGTAWAWRGNAAGLGGFYYRCRFSIASIGTTARVQSIIGLSNTLTPAFTNWVTDTTTPRVALCFDLTSAGGVFTGNWQMVECNGVAVTAHDLGANFTVNATDYLEVILSCAQNDTKISYTVNNLTSGASTSGILNATIPSNTTFLAPCCRTNLNTIVGGTQSLAITHMYLETFDG
jgi:hypothetical protein